MRLAIRAIAIRHHVAERGTRAEEGDASQRASRKRSGRRTHPARLLLCDRLLPDLDPFSEVIRVKRTRPGGRILLEAGVLEPCKRLAVSRCLIA